MPDTKISAAADIVSVVATDMLPVARSGSTTAYHATMAEIATWATTNLPTASTTVLGGVKIDGTSVTIASGVISAVTPLSSTNPLMDGTANPGVGTTASRTDHVHPSDTTKAPLTSPALTGSPTAPTVTPATDSSTKLATTAFVQSALPAVPVVTTTLPIIDGTATIGASGKWADGAHIHPTDTSRAPVASPTFTGTVTIPAGATITGYAPLASPTFTGTPSLPTGTTGITQTAGNNTTALATTQFVQAAAAPAFNDTGRNLLHNGQFNVAQRGTGAFTASGYTADRWSAGAVTDTISFQISPMTNAYRTQIGDEAATSYLALGFTGNAAAGAQSYIEQRIEGVRRLAGKTVTVSLWIQSSSATLKLGVNVYQYPGTGGSPAGGGFALATGNSFPTTTSWVRVSTTITLPSSSGMTLGTNGDDSTILRFFTSSGATNNASAGNIGVQSGSIAIWGTQLEIGSVATPLAYRDPQQELALCQRFFQFVYVSVRSNAPAAGAIYDNSVNFATMRASPTATLNAAGSSSNASSISLNIYSSTGARFEASSNAAGDCYALGYSYALSADL